MNCNAKRLFNLKEEKKILERSLNLYYFDHEKRDMLFNRLDKVIKEIERVENENRNSNSACHKEKPSTNNNG